MNTDEAVIQHFTRRAPEYDDSSRWCTDEVLINKLHEVLQLTGTEMVLDVACGTALMARALRARVARVVGVDITPEMLDRGRPHLDEAILANAEALPFDAGRFDLTICRQGLQFLDAPRAVAEMVRVTRPGGQVCLINLCAYGDDDRQEFFEILRLRNPARRHFFVREDLERLLRQAGCRTVTVHDHISIEDVNIWSSKAAIDDDRIGQLRDVYLQASPAFRQRHRLEVNADGRIIDHMLFGIAVGTP
jgi:SAM-dependent methyltransferase